MAKNEAVTIDRAKHVTFEFKRYNLDLDRATLQRKIADIQEERNQAITRVLKSVRKREPSITVDTFWRNLTNGDYNHLFMKGTKNV